MATPQPLVYTDWLGCLVTGYLSLGLAACVAWTKQPITEQDQDPVTNHRPAPATGRHLTWSDWSHHISDGCCQVSGCQVVFPPNSGLMDSHPHSLGGIWNLESMLDPGGFIHTYKILLSAPVQISP